MAPELGENTYVPEASFAERLGPILSEVVVRTGFIYDGEQHPISIELVDGSMDKLKSICIRGTHKGRQAVLKVKGVEEIHDEATMMQYYLKQYQPDEEHTIIRPPHVYAAIPWGDENKYSAFVMEDAGNSPLVISIPDSRTMLPFFNAYSSYHTEGVREPWIEKPDTGVSDDIAQLTDLFSEKTDVIRGLEDSHPTDLAILHKSLQLLADNYQGVDSTFQKGSFSPTDIYHLKPQSTTETEEAPHDEGDEVSLSESDDLIMLSNSDWGWKAPYTDLAEGYYQLLTSLSVTPGVTPQEIEDYGQMYTDYLKVELTEPDQQRLWKLAKLKSGVKWFLTVAPELSKENPLSSYLMQRIRENLISLNWQIGTRDEE